MPNLGGFVAHYVVARYDEQEQLFLPPNRTLGFNPHLTMNDSLLVQSYIDAYDMGYTEAVDAIESEVRELLDIMSQSGSYELNNLGRLYYDKDGHMNFEPFESGILTPEFYALSSFEMPLLKADTASQADNTTNETEDSAARKPHVVYIGTEDGRKTLNISLKAIRNVGVAAVLAAAIYFVGYPLAKVGTNFGTGNVESGFYEMFFPKHTDNTSSVQLTKPTPIKLSNESKEAPVVQEKSQPATTPAKTTAEDKQEPQEAEPYWSLVVCSHVTKKNAEALVDKMHKDGFDQAYISTSGAVKVLYGHFATKEEAHAKLNEMTSGEYFKDAWLLEVK